MENRKKSYILVLILGLIAVPVALGFGRARAQEVSNATSTSAAAVVEIEESVATVPAAVLDSESLVNATSTTVAVQEEAPVPETPPTTPPQDITEIGEDLGLEEAEETEIEQEDKSIRVKARAETEEPIKKNQEGLSIVRGDVTERPDEILFFEKQGTKTETVKVKDLIDLTDSGGAAAQVSGKKTKKLDEIEKREKRGETGIAIDVSKIKIEKKEERTGVLEKTVNFFFGGGTDENAGEIAEETFEFEVSLDGEIELTEAKNIEGDEEIVIEYDYGTYTDPFAIDFLNITMSESFVVESLSRSDTIRAIEGMPVQDEPAAQKVVPEVGEVRPSPELDPTTPVAPVVNATPTAVSILENASSTPEVLGESVENGTGWWNRVKGLFRGSSPQLPITHYHPGGDQPLAGQLLPKAIAQGTSQTVQAFQVKMKAATEKGEQTFQVLPNGLVYLYHGSSIEAISRPKFQYQTNGQWREYNIQKASVGTLEETSKATHVINYETLEGDPLAITYEFGLDANTQLIKKQTWSIGGSRRVRVVWETLFRVGTEAHSDLVTVSSAKTTPFDKLKTMLYGDIVLDASDYNGNTRVEEDSENNIVRVYFEEEGVDAPLIIDPSFAVVTSDQFIEIETPDYGEEGIMNQESGGENGWKVRFNRLKGGTIDGYYHNSVDNGNTNIVSQATPLFNIGYNNSTAKDLSQESAYSMEVIERGDTRVKVRSQVSLGNDTLDITYTMYLAGQIYADISHTIQDGSIGGQNNVYQLTQSYAGYQAGYELQDASTKAIGIDSTQADSALIPYTASDVGQINTSENQSQDIIQTTLGTSSLSKYQNGNTAQTQFLLNLAFNNVTIQQFSNVSLDYQQPDDLEPFTLGTNGEYNEKEGTYEMTADANHVEFQMNGAAITRYQPIFEIHNWTNQALGGVYAELDSGEIVQDFEYIVTFQNGDPTTQILVFQYLDTVVANQIFFIDPTCTSTAAGNWSTVFDCGTPGSGDDVTIDHDVTFDVGTAVTVLSLTINSGDTLDFSTSADRELIVTNDITVNGTLQCRGSSSTSIETTLKLNGADAADAGQGLIVSTTGFLDWQGQSVGDQDCIITSSNGTGTNDGYIELQTGSETIIKYAEISYMGTSTPNNKWGIAVGYSAGLNGDSANEGFIMQGSKVHNAYVGLYLIARYIVVEDSEFYSNEAQGLYTSYTGSGNNVIHNNKIYSNSADGMRFDDGVGNVFAKNVIYDNTGGGSADGIRLNGAQTNNSFVGNIISGNGVFGIAHWSGTEDNGFYYNNTINNNGNDGIAINGDNNTLKNNIFSNQTVASTEGIDDNGTGNLIDNNYFYNNTSDGTIGTNAVTGTDPSYVSTVTSPLNIDFLYLDANSAGLGAGAHLRQQEIGTADADSSTTAVEDDSQGWTNDEWINFRVIITGGTGVGESSVVTDNDGDTLTVSPALTTTPDATSTFALLPQSPGTINVGGRLGYVVNDQAGSADSGPDEFNALKFHQFYDWWKIVVEFAESKTTR